MSVKPYAKKVSDFDDASSALTSIAPSASVTVSPDDVAVIADAAAKIALSGSQSGLQSTKGVTDQFTTQIMDFAHAVVPLFPTLPTLSPASQKPKSTTEYKDNITAILAKKKGTDQFEFVEFPEEQVTQLQEYSIGLIAARVKQEIAANPKSVSEVCRLLDGDYSKLYASLYAGKEADANQAAEEKRKALVETGILIAGSIAGFDNRSGFTATLSKPGLPTSGAPKPAAKPVSTAPAAPAVNYWSAVSGAFKQIEASPTSENINQFDKAYGVAYGATYDLINKVNRKQFLSEIIAAEAKTLLTDLKQEKDRVVAKLTTEIQNHQFWENIVPIVQVGFETRLEKLGRVFQINDSEVNLWIAIGEKLFNC